MNVARFGLVTVVLCLAAVAASGQDLPHQWSQSFGDDERDFCFAVATDPLGNILIAGSFEGTVDFGGGDLTSVEGRDVYVAKLDPNGAHLWSASFGDYQTQHATSITTDEAGNVFVTGYFMNRIDLGGGMHVGAGGWDIFVAKYSPTGVYQWSHIYGDYADQWGTGIDVDAAGRVFITGYFQGAVDFGGGPLPTAGNWDAYLTRLDNPAGGHVWSQRFGDPSEQVATSLDVNEAGEVAVCGHFSGTVNFGGGPLIGHGDDVWVAVYSPDGAHRWSQSGGDYSSQVASDVAIDIWGNVALTGEFEGGLDLGGGTLASAGASDIFLAHYDAAGAHRWSQSFGDAEYQMPAALTMDSSGGNIVLVGTVAGTVDFGGGPLITAGEYDASFAVFDADGTHLLSRMLGDDDFQYSGCVTTDRWGDVVCAGFYRGTIDLGGGALSSNGDWDIFLAKYGLAPQGVEDEPGVSGLGEAFSPLGFRVEPNPCRGGTTLHYVLPQAGQVTLQVFDAQGRVRESLAAGWQGSGPRALRWSPAGPPAEGGVYYLRLNCGQRAEQMRVTVLP